MADSGGREQQFQRHDASAQHPDALAQRAGGNTHVAPIDLHGPLLHHLTHGTEQRLSGGGHLPTDQHGRG
ncbi:hypothetical protein, partial [Deinococcus sp.]|uniref:hypothetical protein n=1 Tax=Deinococcus sp. TaxID=47478 RepID=UPI00286E2AEC